MSLETNPSWSGVQCSGPVVVLRMGSPDPQHRSHVGTCLICKFLGPTPGQPNGESGGGAQPSVLTKPPEDSDARSSLRTTALITPVSEFQFSYLPRYVCTFCPLCLEYSFHAHSHTSAHAHTFVISLSYTQTHTHTIFLPGFPSSFRFQWKCRFLLKAFSGHPFYLLWQQPYTSPKHLSYL